MIKHYVYMIINKLNEKCYIGSRSTDEEDIMADLKRYKSSSRDVDFIRDQYELPEIFEYKILNEFGTREEAIEYEIELHEEYDVGNNDLFYNKVKQTSVGFDTSGMVSVRDKETGECSLVSKEEYRENARYEHVRQGLVTVYDVVDETTKSVTVKEYKDNPERYQTSGQGKVLCYDTIDRKCKSVATADYNTDERYVSLSKGMVTVIDTRDNQTKSVKVSDYNTNDHYISVAYGKVNCIDKETGQWVTPSREYFKANREKYSLPTEGFVTCIDTRTNTNKLVPEKEFHNKSYYVGHGTGMVTVRDTRDGSTKSVSVDDHSKYDYYVAVAHGVVTCKDRITGESVCIPKEEYDNNRSKYKRSDEGMVKAINIETGESVFITQDEYYSNSDKYRHSGKGMCVVYDTVQQKNVKIKSAEFEANRDRYKRLHEDEISCIDLADMTKKYVPEDEFWDGHRYIHTSAKSVIKIYNADDELVEIVSKHQHPYISSKYLAALMKTTKENPINYSNKVKHIQTQARNKGWDKYNGWYIVKVPIKEFAEAWRALNV